MLPLASFNSLDQYLSTCCIHHRYDLFAVSVHIRWVMIILHYLKEEDQSTEQTRTHVERNMNRDIYYQDKTFAFWCTRRKCDIFSKRRTFLKYSLSPSCDIKVTPPCVFVLAACKVYHSPLIAFFPLGCYSISERVNKIQLSLPLDMRISSHERVKGIVLVLLLWIL